MKARSTLYYLDLPDALHQKWYAQLHVLLYLLFDQQLKDNHHCKTYLQQNNQFFYVIYPC